jgi:hypothetical protein
MSLHVNITVGQTKSVAFTMLVSIELKQNVIIISNVKFRYVQSTTHQTILFGLRTAIISMTLGLISSCKCIA